MRSGASISAVALSATLAICTISAPSAAKDAHCASAETEVAAIAAKLPIEVDAVTNTTSAKAHCDKKQVVLARKVELKQSRMEANFQGFLQKQDKTAFCANKASRELIDAGWQWTVRYTFQDGSPVNINAKCGG